MLPKMMNGCLFFFQEFLKHPFQIGSVIPSSQALIRRVIETAKVDEADVIVELGPGTGCTTKAILENMKDDAKLLSIEINPNFYSIISEIPDPRLIAHLGDARKLKDILREHNLGAPQTVISGIPFSTMSDECGTQIIQAINDALAPGGRFVAYQLSKKVISLCTPVMGQEKVEMEFLNIPPMRVCCWEKGNGNGSGPGRKLAS
ncbi:MAG: methyltransferase type 12 [Thermodesulfobacteria bacterium]|nr:methyltransferase type 12 [Thermodesulfobacteriota bacterium]